MLKVYKGKLKNKAVTFENDVPDQEEAEVLVIIEEVEGKSQDKKELLKAFEAVRGMWKDKENLDSMEYQKKVRKEWEDRI
ncbi:MAG: hypothetical protein IEMM0008_0054 [bacterium]|nr:MAG: hypothetical protein IEMM0008_0054 [bacterium]